PNNASERLNPRGVPARHRAQGTKHLKQRLPPMPIRAYFLVIGPALAGLIWFIGWYLEPARPVQAPATATPPPVTTTARAQPATTTGAATMPTATPAPVAATSVAATSVAATPAVQSGSELRPSVELEPAKPVEIKSAKATKPKKRKQIAHRRQNPY